MAVATAKPLTITITVPGILKVVTIVIGLISTAIGSAAHFNSMVKTLYDLDGAEALCKQHDECPSSSLAMERFFVGVTIVFLILSVVNLLAGFLMNLRDLKCVDVIYHVLAGLLVLIAGILMIISAVRINGFLLSYHGEIRGMDFIDKSIKKMVVEKGTAQLLDILLEMMTRYDDKLAAGVMAIINGILYFVTAGLIFLIHPKLVNRRELLLITV